MKELSFFLQQSGFHLQQYQFPEQPDQFHSLSSWYHQHTDPHRLQADCRLQHMHLHHRKEISSLPHSPLSCCPAYLLLLYIVWFHLKVCLPLLYKRKHHCLKSVPLYSVSVLRCLIPLLRHPVLLLRHSDHWHHFSEFRFHHKILYICHWVY